MICHGIPDQRELQGGDIVNVDVTAFIGGYHGDLNETFCVGEVSDSLLCACVLTSEMLNTEMHARWLVNSENGLGSTVVWVGGGGGLTLWQLHTVHGHVTQRAASDEMTVGNCGEALPPSPLSPNTPSVRSPPLPPQVDPASKALVRASHDSLLAAVGACRPGVRFRDLGDIISKHVNNAG